MNGRKPAKYSPFNYIPLSESYRSSQEDSSQFDPASFYRNLLGLKLHFTHDELKKSYREAIGKYHPDRYGASSPRDRENAEMLMKQVNEAYEKLKKIAV
jgi:preprotein translocase subunit Sec63